MSAPEPGILTMEEVRRFARAAERINYSLPADDAARLCASVEHYAGQLGKVAEALGYPRDLSAPCNVLAHTVQGIARNLNSSLEEGARLSALVARQREALGRAWSIAAAATHECSLVSDLMPILTGSLFDDPDGRRAAEEAAKDREAAGRWRALMSEAEDATERTEVLLRATQDYEDGQEELRLLRDVEVTRVILQEGKATGKDVRKASRDHDDAWDFLAAFRARQKGAQR